MKSVLRSTSRHGADTHRAPRRSAKAYKFISHTDHKTHKRIWIWNLELNPMCSMCPLWQKLFNPSSFAALRLECRRCMQRQTGVRTSFSPSPDGTSGHTPVILREWDSDQKRDFLAVRPKEWTRGP